MDAMSWVGGIAVGGVLGGVVAVVVLNQRARAAARAAETLQAELAVARSEAGGLRQEAGAARQAEAAARATLEAVQQQGLELRAQVEAERARADQESAARAEAQQEQRAVAERIAERERSIAELRATVEQSRTALTEAFKATGADVLRQAAEQLLRQAKDQFDGQRTLSQAELEARQKAIDATLTPLKEQLARNEQLVKELGERREGDAKALGEQLRQVAELQQRASSAAQTLSSALRDNRQRGRWGEVSLRNIAELAGLVANVDFGEQSSVEGDSGNLLRPDMTVRLPGGRFVPIDAKVPMNAYLDSLDPALPEADRLARRATHAQALRNHVRALASRRYAEALGGGVEVTVLFVPLESGLIAALEEDATIYTEALDKRVILTTASTLLALLRTCALQWQQAKLNENARRIGDSARELLTRIGVFAEHLEKMGKGLEGASKAYNSAVGSFNARLLPGARDTAELAGAPERLPVELDPVATVPREVGVPVREIGGGSIQ